MNALLVVGAGTAGAELALAARQQGWAGEIVLFGDEGRLPYHRPPLSKGYLSGETEADALPLRPASAYANANVELRAEARVVGLDAAARRVRLADGSTLGYAALALCTGGVACTLALPGLDPARPPRNLHVLRTLADADALRPRLVPDARIAIVGAGYVGLEVAASARKAGAAVTVLEAQPRVLARSTGATLAAFYADVHAEAGVDLRCGVGVADARVGADGDVAALVLADGTELAVDAVVAGIGMRPATALAEQAGLAVDGGIVVDAFSRTSDPHVVAAGDCTVQDSALYGRRIRLESVPNALEQARTAAATLCGKPRENRAVPWFWSDQYALKLQMTGLAHGHDAVVVRGSLAERSFVAFSLREGRVIAAEAVNRPGDFVVAKRLVAEGVAAEPERLADVAQPLKGLLAPVAAPAA